MRAPALRLVPPPPPQVLYPNAVSKTMAKVSHDKDSKILSTLLLGFAARIRRFDTHCFLPLWFFLSSLTATENPA